MGLPVLIEGESGSGKSRSLKNFKPGEISIFNVAGKPLPFKTMVLRHFQWQNLSRRTKAKAVMM